MKFIITVVSMVAIVAFTKAGHTKKNFPNFLESLKQTHRRLAEITVDQGKGVETKWMTQRLDHFNEQNKRTWRMRYMVNAQHFKEGGAMFIHVGGETSVVSVDIQRGIFSDLAKEHKGILFLTEHRYYGKSIPTSDFSIENLQYLHTKQALADLAHFIRTQRANDSRLTNSRVIISGCSYPGSLVIWFSKLYPELVNGGWASSAPILAQVNFKEFNEIAGKVFRELGSQQCYNRIQNGIAELEAMFADNRSAEAKQMLLLCDSFDHNNNMDLSSLFNIIIGDFTALAQHQMGPEILHMCRSIMSFQFDVSAIVDVFVLNHFFGQDCIDVAYQKMLASHMDVSLRRGNLRPWFYQLCNEFGWFQTTNSTEQPFGTKVPAALQMTMCYDVFGPQYSNEHIHDLVAETNEFFGGLQPGVRNVYVTHGALDPWSPLGLNETHGASVIPGSSHCSDFDSISSSDSPEMRASKERLVNLVREWLA